jgi:glycosyltransferase involved in cell wall biosynthesis
MDLARDADVIQTFNYHACLPSLVAGKRLGKPVVCLLLGLFDQAWKEMKGSLRGRGYIAWERMLVRRGFSRLIFLSEYSRQIGLKLGAPPERLRVNSYGLDTQYFRPALKKDNAVLFAGKLDVRKGVYDLLAAAKALPHLEFKVLGWGPEEPRMRAIATPNVQFLGFDQGELYRTELGRSLVYVLPTRAEGLPVALLEAMASGCAIVSTLPFEFAGEHVRAGDPEQLTAALQRLAASPERAIQMGQSNREVAQQYTWERFGTSLLRTYEEVLDEQAGGPDQCRIADRRLQPSR